MSRLACPWWCPHRRIDRRIARAQRDLDRAITALDGNAALKAHNRREQLFEQRRRYTAPR